MKYDYFKIGGSTSLYRVPTGHQTPVQVAIGARWEESYNYRFRVELLGDRSTEQIDIVRALELAGAAPVDSGGYQYYEKHGGTILLYRAPAGAGVPIEYFDEGVWCSSERTQIPAPGEGLLTFSRITEARARQLEPSAFPSSATRYFWWETSYEVSPYLLRVNPDDSVDYYAECDMGHAFIGWTGGNAYTVDYLCACDSVDEISESTARSRRPAAFSTDYSRNLSPGPDAVRYFVNEFDLYRLTGADTFHFWSFVNKAWSAPVTPGSVIVGYEEVTAQQGKDFMPKAEIAGATAPAELLADFSIPGTEETLAVKMEFVDGKLHISVYEIQ